jgi:hypothetical protein
LGFFLHSEPSAAEVEPFARVLERTGYELKPMLRALFSSRLFYEPRWRGARIKSPIELAVSTARMLGLEREIPARLLAAGAANLGQALLAPPNVKGWEGGTAWITTSSLLARYNFMRALLGLDSRSAIQGRAGNDRVPNRAGNSPRAAGVADRPQGAGERAMELIRANRGPTRDQGLPGYSSSFSAVREVRSAGAQTSEQIVDLFVARFLCVPLGPNKRQAMVDFLDGRDGSQALDATPVRAEIKLRELIHLIMSTPEFQVC